MNIEEFQSRIAILVRIGVRQTAWHSTKCREEMEYIYGRSKPTTRSGAAGMGGESRGALPITHGRASGELTPEES